MDAPQIVKDDALEAVKLKREYQHNAEAHFIEAVKDASAMGCSLREIAEAAGLTSHSKIQRILKNT